MRRPAIHEAEGRNGEGADLARARRASLGATRQREILHQVTMRLHGSLTTSDRQDVGVDSPLLMRARTEAPIARVDRTL